MKKWKGSYREKDEHLPYVSKFREFEKHKKLLRREDIYGSGSPSDEVSGEVFNLIRRFAGKTVLDMGCGGGAYMESLEQEGYACKGIEIKREYVEYCRVKGLDVVQMDAEEVGFAQASFDTVIMIEVLEYLEQPLRALRRAFHMARKNVLVSVPNINVLPYLHRYGVVPWHLLEATHLHFFTPKILDDCLRRFASDTEIYYYGPFAPWVTEQQLSMQLFGVGSVGSTKV